MALCVLTAAKTLTFAVATFSLSWMHSVEHTGWQEEWQVTPQGLSVIEARIKGSGAGMEPPPDAVLRDDWWVYTPHVPPLRDVVLAASGATGGGWTLCAGGQCTVLGEQSQEPIHLKLCP